MSDKNSTSWEDGINSALNNMKKMRDAVVIDDDEIVFVEFDYGIPLDECSSHAEILRWVLHIDEKIWSTKDLISAFIVRALDANDLEV